VKDTEPIDDCASINLMINVNGNTVVSDTGFTLKVMDVGDVTAVEYREGDKLLKGGLETQWALKVYFPRWGWEAPYEKELITHEKGKQIEANILEALDSLRYYYYSF